MIRNVKQVEQNISKWNGGTTTELFIFPENSSLINRDFDFRISSASVEIKESIFSNFHGFQRKLMVLEGQIELQHSSHHKIKLIPFDVDEFNGNWQTKCIGKCIDFNIIYRPNYKCELESINSNIAKVKICSDFNFIYCLQSKIIVSIEDFKYVLYQNDFLIIKKKGAAIQFDSDIELIVFAAITIFNE